MSQHEATEVERNRQHEANKWRLNLIIALLTAIAGYIAIVISVAHPFKSKIDPIFHSQNQQQEVAQYNAKE